MQQKNLDIYGHDPIPWSRASDQLAAASAADTADAPQTWWLSTTGPDGQPHTTGVGCLYVKALKDVDLDVLEAILARSHATLTAGTFPYHCQIHPSMTGVIRVPIVVTPAQGPRGTTFTVWLPVRFAPTEPGFGEPNAVRLGTGD